MNLKLVRIFLMFILYILFHITYVDIIVPEFGYLGFVNKDYSFYMLLMHCLIILVLTSLQLFMKISFYNIIYNIFLIMIVYGQSVVSLHSNTNELFGYVIIPTLFLFTIDLLDKKNIKIKRKQFNVENRYFAILSIIFSIILIVPFLKNIGSMNLSNLLLNDIYDSRLNTRSDNSNIMDYLYSSIARVIFPFLIVFFWFRNKKLYSVIVFGFIILLFLLNGAVKSILFGALATIVFYPFRYSVKNVLFIITINVFFAYSIISYRLFDSITMADYLRRIFYLPAYLFSIYKQTFSGNFTYYSQTILGSIFNIPNKIDNVAQFIGEQVLKQDGMVANAGIFVEGYISMGMIGVIINSLIFVLLIFILKCLDFKPQYFGIIFTYMYIINTSFLETLLITHGLLFLIIFGYFFIPTDNKRRIKIENSFNNNSNI
ncbi:O-antigen polymerase [Staphylococcus hominis]|uniref:O-antigen polymerase n=1 Tax=Staphylococcus hominis TaxID=1290 RepID=UPI0039B42246